MISSGLFVLPAIAYRKAGPAVILSYLFASILVVPSVFSKAELSTAMPRAGGTYLYVERSLGSIPGLFSGLANWFSVALKSAFALVGMAVFIRIAVESMISIRLTDQQEAILLKTIASLFCLGFMFLNIISVKHIGRLQVWLVMGMFGILTLFIVTGTKSIVLGRYEPFLTTGWAAVFATTGMVFVSFGGLTKVASVAEEVINPAKNLALGMILAWFFVTLLYLGTVAVTVGVTARPELAESLTPISLAAGNFMGPVGVVLVTLAAMAAFITTANAGILASSRQPLAMSRDKLLPAALSRLSIRFRTPHVSIVVTCGFMILAIVLLDIESLVKTASTLMIVLFMLVNASVIIMRESRIQSYRPVFRSPLYPYIHIIAIIAYALLIVQMGFVPLIVTAGFISLSAAWFGIYLYKRGTRQSALMHVVERVTDKELKTVTLEDELRDILLQRDEVVEDRFDKLVRECEIIDLQESSKADEVFRTISKILAKDLYADENGLLEKFIQREAEGTTVVQPGLAIPHIILEGEKKFDIVLVRAREGVTFPHAAEPVKAIFVLAGSKDERNYHLRALMAIAQIAQDENFEKNWLEARDTQAIRNLILLSTRKRDAG
jgi:APA family basic amino acid/polyamine antiporter